MVVKAGVIGLKVFWEVINVLKTYDQLRNYFNPQSLTVKHYY